MSETVRSFVAVDIPDAVRDEVGRLQAKLRGPADGIRWVRPDRMHLTLAFLGEVPMDFVDRAKEALPGSAAQQREFEAQLGGLGAFPDTGRARVVWVGMNRGREALVELQRSVADALELVGYQPESRPFSPHLTIGRLRPPGDVRGACGTAFESQAFPVTEVNLYRSVLRPQGPEYSVLARFPLAASDEP